MLWVVRRQGGKAGLLVPGSEVSSGGISLSWNPPGRTFGRHPFLSPVGIGMRAQWSPGGKTRLHSPADSVMLAVAGRETGFRGRRMKAEEWEIASGLSLLAAVGRARRGEISQGRDRGFDRAGGAAFSRPAGDHPV